MHQINHRVGIKASAQKIYQLLTTDSGLSQWWTNDTSGAGDVGSVIAFRFNGGGPDFKVVELVENEVVRWAHSGDMPPGWAGTEVVFLIQPEAEQTIVRFSHENWAESSDFMAHCSTKWAVFMVSLKQAAETGQGKPFPDDISIDYS